MYRLIIQGGLALFVLLVIVGFAVIFPLNQQVAELSERVAQLEGRSAPATPSVVGDIAALAQQVEKLTVRLGRMEGPAPPPDQDFRMLSGQMDFLTDRFAALESELSERAAVSASLSEMLAALSARVDTLAAVDAPEVDLEPLRRDMERLSTRVAAVETKGAASPDDVAGLTASLGDLVARVDGLERRDAPPPIEFVLLQQEVKALGDRLQAVEAAEPATPAPVDLAPLQKRMSDLATRLAELEKRPAAKQSEEIGALAQQVQRLARVVETMGRRGGSLTAGELWTMQQEVNKLAYRLESVEDGRRALTAGIGSLRNEVRALQKRVEAIARQLPPSEPRG